MINDTFTFGNKLYFLFADTTRLQMRKRPGSRKRKTDTSASQLNTPETGQIDECNVVSAGDEYLHDTVAIVANCDNSYTWTDSHAVMEHNWQSPPGAWQTVEGHSDESFNQFRRLTEKEKKCLSELERKYVTAIETEIPGFSESLDEVKDFLNTSMIWAKKLVTYVKSVDDFKQLSKEAQVLSIKSSVRMALTLIGAYRLDVSKNSFYIQGAYVSVDLFMRAFSSHKEVAEQFINTCFSMQDVWFKDPTLHALFHLILLFCPDGPELLQHELMSDLQNKYLILLKHYLEYKYSYRKCKEYFALLLKRGRELRNLSIVFTEVLVDTDPQKIDPLTKEVYNFENIYFQK